MSMLDNAKSLRRNLTDAEQNFGITCARTALWEENSSDKNR